MSRVEDDRIVLGLRENLAQFLLLVAINAFVGGMVGLERTVVPLIAEREFGLASKTLILSFIVSFGIVKAITNLLTGRASDRIGRKRLLVLGWLVGLPVPFMIMWAPTWSWVAAANVLLGVNQGLCWSTTVIMKIDLVGPRRRGLAMGLNEFAGYGAVALAAFASSALAETRGLRPPLFVLGVTFAVLGLVLSLAFARDTMAHARVEARGHPGAAESPSFRDIFARTSYREPNLFAASQAGLVNNLNDGLAWGLLPLFLAASGLDLTRIGVVAGIYPAVWGVGQLATGALSDRWGRKWMITWGMWIQAGALALIASTPQLSSSASARFALWIAAAVLLGLGTALVYPTLLAAIADVVDPGWRASAMGVYRFWRDLGYAAGAVLAGVVADLLGSGWAFAAVAALTFASGANVALKMRSSSRASPA